MSERRRFGLAAKINLLAIALILATAGGLSAYSLHTELAEAQDRLLHQGIAFAQLAAEQAEFPVYTHNAAAIDRALQALARQPNLGYLALFDGNDQEVGRRVVESSLALPQQLAPRRWRLIDGVKVYIPDDRIDPIEIMAPIVSGGVDAREAAEFMPGAEGVSPKAGWVRVGMSRTELNRELADLVRNMLSIVTLVAVLAIGVTLALTRRITRPVRQLAAVAKRIADGDFKPEIAIHTGDEIEDLAEAMRAMTLQLDASHARLVEHQQLLEQKVEQRTRQLKYASEQAMRLARHDVLTGLPNRGSFLERLEDAVTHCRRYRERLGVLYLDVDHFKRINDSLGHNAGDQILREVAIRVRRAIRDTDLLARLTSDEFAVLLDRVDDISEVSTVAERVAAAFERPFIIGGQPCKLGTSLGISLFPDDGGDAETLLKHADLAMFSAKEAGRGSFRFYVAEMNTRVVARMTIETGLRRALERVSKGEVEFRLLYQPQYDLKSGRPFGAEALLRWQPEGQAPVSPAEFVPVAEDAGLVGAIGGWVLGEACKQAQLWQQRGLPFSRIAVNVSARQFEQPDFVTRIAQVLEVSRLKPASLDLELTESTLIRNIDAALAMLQELKSLGVSISLDDFGTGYSSLSYLTRLPVDTIKIDRSFVHRLGRDTNADQIVYSIIALAHSLGHRVVAEGVETAAQLDLLREHGCDELQGFLFSPPVDAERLASLFETALARN